MGVEFRHQEVCTLVELYFINESNDRINSSDMIYNNFVPVPNEGENITLEGIEYKVKRRHFMYFKDEIRVLIYVKEW